MNPFIQISVAEADIISMAITSVLITANRINKKSCSFPTGSAYICPKVGFHDIDIAIWLGHNNSQFDTFIDKMLSQFKDCRLSADYRPRPSNIGNQSNPYYSFTSIVPIPYLNIIAFNNLIDYKKYIFATLAAHALNVTDKSKRIELFDTIMFEVDSEHADKYYQAYDYSNINHYLMTTSDLLENSNTISWATNLLYKECIK